MPNKYQVPALLRAERIIDLLSKKNADLAVIMSELDLPKSTTYSLLLTLEEIGFIRRLPDGHQFALGFRLFELGNLAVSKVSIREHAVGHLQSLSHQENITCHLGVLDGNEAVYLLKVDPQDSILINSWEGKRVTLNRSAMGKILLSWQSDERKEALLKTVDFKAVTPKTITDKDAFRNHIADVRRQGWAMDDEEDIIGIRCIAAPVFTPDGTVKYSLSVSGTTQKITESRIKELTETVIKVAIDISRGLGASPDPHMPYHVEL